MTRTKVWSRFFSKTKNRTDLKFRIEEMPEDKLEEVTNLMMDYFVTEEPTHRAAGIAKNPLAMKEMREWLSSLLDTNPKVQRVDICVLDDGTESENSVIGASILVLTKKENLFDAINIKAETEEMKTLVRLIAYQTKKINILEKYNLESYYDDRAVVISPKYRGLGIAQEFFKVRRFVCKDHNVPLTAAWMTSFGSQKAAKRDGWETEYEMNYEEFGKQMGVVFENVPETCIYMIARNE